MTMAFIGTTKEGVTWNQMTKEQQHEVRHCFYGRKMYPGEKSDESRYVFDDNGKCIYGH